jgi:hypothetical protein
MPNLMHQMPNLDAPNAPCRIQGYYSGVRGASACSACGVGTYSDGVFVSACTVCPAGLAFYANASGRSSYAAACLAVPCPIRNSITAFAGGVCVCAAGFFQNGSCSPCAPGTYAAAINATACFLCPINTYDPATLASTLRNSLQGVCAATSANCFAPVGATDFSANAG